MPRAARRAGVVDLRQVVTAWILRNVGRREIPDLLVAVHQRHQVIRGRYVRAALRRLALRPRGRDHLLGDENEYENQQHKRYQHL